MGGSFWTYKFINNSYKDLHSSHWMTMCKNMEQGFHLTHFPICFTTTQCTCSITDIKPSTHGNLATHSIWNFQILSYDFLASFHPPPLQAIMSIPTHVFATSIQINYFCDFKYDYPSKHLVKMTCSHIDNYKVVYNCICNLYLRLMLIWIKMKMKNTFIASIF